MSAVFTLTKEQMEAQASLVWGIAIDHLRQDGAISKEVADQYLDYTVVIVTRESLVERLWRFFKQAPEGQSQLKFKIVNMKEAQP